MTAFAGMPLTIAVLGLPATFGLAALGRWLAVRLRQPPVIGELVLGLATGTLIAAIVDHDVLQAADAVDGLSGLRWMGNLGLVLFLVGVAYHLRVDAQRLPRRTVGAVAAGALAIPLLFGGLLAAWVLASSDPGLRGSARAPAVAMYLAVAMSVTAVPVLARIVADRGLSDSNLGRISLAAAMVIDAVTWMLLAGALGLAAGDVAGPVRAGLITVACVLAVVLLRWLTNSEIVRMLPARFPHSAVWLVAAGALGTTWALDGQGLSGVFGALLLGFAIGRPEWQRAVDLVTRAGRLLMPAFFVVTGFAVFAQDLGHAPWVAITVVTVFGMLGKISGGYLGSRAGGLNQLDALRIGVLLNTRGLTELAVLQVGYSAGLLTPVLYFAFVVMALVTTSMTGPATALIDRFITRTAGASRHVNDIREKGTV